MQHLQRQAAVTRQVTHQTLLHFKVMALAAC